MTALWTPPTHDDVLLTDVEIEAWLDIVELVRAEPLLLPQIRLEAPDLFEGLVDFCQEQMLVDRALGWRQQARPEQLIPGTPGAACDEADWLVWLLCGGRGSGKSRVGSEATREIVLGRNWTHKPDQALWALVGPTAEAVRAQMIGALLQVLPTDAIADYSPSRLEIVMKNGVILRGYSSQQPNQLRGTNLIGAWCDELASWKDADKAPSEDSTWSNLILACRALDDGTWSPRVIATTTPKPVRLLHVPDDEDEHFPGLMDDEDTVVTRMKTKDNLANLAPHFRRKVVKRLEGTRLGRQELEGELITEVEGALWTGDMVTSMRKPETWPEGQAGGILRVVIGVDPSAGDGTGDECGIVVVGLAADRRAYVLEDCSTRGRSEHWVPRVKTAFENWHANFVVVEENTGYDGLDTALRLGAPNVPIKYVWAKAGKKLRAEPVSMMSSPDQDRVRLAGRFPKLEHQMQNWDPLSDKESPDRLDAFVYACLNLIPPDGVEELFSVRGGGNANR